MLKIKISLLGEGGVGKTSLSEKYTSGNFDKQYTPTIAVDYKNRIIPHKDLNVNVNIWDFSGHPEFFEVRNEFYKETTAILLVFDITVKKSLDGLDMWMREASKYGAKDAIVFVCGNKSDESSKRIISESEGRQWAKSRDFTYWEVSALKGTNIEEMFNDLIERSIQK